MIDMEVVAQDLMRDEGWRSFLYDDATGSQIGPGTKCIGHPTIGFGFALDVSPLTQAEAMPILMSRAKNSAAILVSRAKWILDKPDSVQRALFNMAYQLGPIGLLKLSQFLLLLEQNKYIEAADDLAETLWYRQSGDRGQRIQSLIRSGADDGNN